VAGQRLLAIADELETWMKRNHLLTVPGNRPHTHTHPVVDQTPKGKQQRVDQFPSSQHTTS